MSIDSLGQVKEPDFAFPATVSKSAKADLKKAEAENDSRLAISALLRLYAADGMIDPASCQQSIKTAENAAKKFEKSDLSGLFDCLIGKMYSRMYNQNRWKYKQRQLPATPLPDDLTEWSGDQFQIKIKFLLLQALSKADTLAELKIGDFSDIIAADKLTRIYYPTVLDFVCSEAISLDSSLKDKAIATGMSHTVEGSPASILWTYRNFDYNTDPKIILEAYQKHKDSDAASLLLAEYVQRMMNRDEDEIEPEIEGADSNPTTGSRWFPLWGVPAIDEYLKRCPAAYTANWLKNLRSQMLQQKASLTMPAFCMPGDTISVDCEIENSPSVTVSLYFIPEASFGKTSFNKNFFASAKPEAQKTIQIEGKAPFKEHRVAKFLIKKYGYYMALPKLEEGENPNYSGSGMRCLPVFPFSINGLSYPMVAVTSPRDGKPMVGLNVDIAQTKNPKKYTAKTDSKGVADFKKFDIPQNRDQIKLIVNYDGTPFNFSEIAPYVRSKLENETRRTVSILTDRGLYHPGDKAHALFVASSMVANANGEKSGKVLAGLPLTATLKNANWEAIDTIHLTTDEFGRATAEFTLPTEGITGNFRIEARGENISGSALFTVSDYKMPDFEIKVTSTLRDEPSAGCVTLKGVATYYSGMPVADAKIDVSLIRSSYLRWYSSSENIFGDVINTNGSGEFSVTFGKDILGQDADGRNIFLAEFNATSPSGTAASCQASFLTGKKYAIEMDNVEKVNGELPFSPSAKVLDADGNEADIDLVWSLLKDKETVAKGRIGAPIDLKNIRPGEYVFQVEPADTTLAMPAKCSMLIYNEKSGIAPQPGLWLRDNPIDFMPGATIETLIACGEQSTVYCIVTSPDGLISLQAIDMKPGYKTIKAEMPDSAAEGCKMILATVKDFKCVSYSVPLVPKKDNGLKIIAESFRDKLVPGGNETWKLRVTDTNGQPATGAMALDMFNKALDAIRPYNPSLGLANIYIGNYIALNSLYAYPPHASASKRVKYASKESLQQPKFKYLEDQIFITGSARTSSRALYKAAAVQDNAMMMAVDELADEETADAGGPIVEEQPASEPQSNVEFRDADVPLAIWAPTLSTDAEGWLCYSFTVPNANTTWKLTALAWTKDLNEGRLAREFVASKPIMVTPNAPRFLRQGDRCVIVASVLNNTDSVCEASSCIEIFNPANGSVISRKEFSDTIQPKASAQISMEINAGYDLPAIGLRVRAENGDGFADGEQQAIPVLTSMASLVETYPFYLNPGETAYSSTLPDSPGGRLSLTFCENPAWTIVTALPGLRELSPDYANSAAASIFSAAVAKGIIADNPEIAKALKAWKENPTDSALVSMLEKNSDLKIAMLSATPWVQAAQSQTERMANLAMIFDSHDADKAIKRAIESLSKLQRPDGGWAWGEWCQNSSLWTTLNVLDMLGQLKSSGWIPKSSDLDKMIGLAVKYCDQKVKGEDIVYAIVRRHFPEIAISLNGKESIAKTTATILKNWKKYSDPAYKAMAAQALYLNDYRSKSKDLMRSISEFGVLTPSQGLKFPSVNALSSYAQILRAYALIEPGAPQVDGLRQQMIMRKQGTDWGSAVVTTEVVAAILSSGAKWTVPAQGAEVSAGGEAIVPTSIENATGCLRADLSKFAGKELEITTSGAGPAYGAVYAQFNKKMGEVKPSASEDLDIEKTLTARAADGTWHYSDSLQVGDRVKVQLTIHCKRNLQYVEIIDERPAALQPASQLPGWMWSEGVGFYRENRDSYTSLHVESMAPGTYILSYEMNVGQAGEYASGVASIQSQYAPEISAHSSGSTLRIAEN
ncbi:MAG: MG2 domain-containing protein [Clostridium sp.]|nr:MG2 domain-containing protein [Clostridium sp.]